MAESLAEPEFSDFKKVDFQLQYLLQFNPKNGESNDTGSP